MKEKNRVSIPLFGGTSLLVIFAVLVLTIFLLLTLTAVQADKRLSDASAQAVRSYYAADLQAEEIFARVRTGDIPPQVQKNANQYWYTCPVTDSQALEVLLQQEENGWQVLRWQTIACITTDTTTTLPVWDGQTQLEEYYD